MYPPHGSHKECPYHLPLHLCTLLTVSRVHCVCVVQVPPHVHASVCYRRFVGTSAEDTPGWRAGLQAPRLHPDAFPRPERSVRLSPRATKSGGGNTTPSRAATP